LGAYILRRLILVVPTLLGIILINFAVIQFAPGGPVEQMLAELRGEGQTLGRLTGEGQGETRAPGGAGPGLSGGGGEGGPVGTYRGARGLDPAVVAEIERAFGFDKPWHERLLTTLWGYLRFDLGRSLFQDRPVSQLILDKMPVSVSLGLWSTLIIYLVSIPLGIRKAVRDGSRFDVATSGVVLVGYAIPSFLFAILLVVLFAGGSFFQWFPLRGLTSPGMEARPSWSALSTTPGTWCCRPRRW
jgi:microcin C transport system permease protein